MSRKPVIAKPEDRLLDALTQATKEGLNPTKVDFDKVPEVFRPRVRSLLAGLAGQAAKPSKTPKAPAFIHTLPKEVQTLVEALRLEESYEEAKDTLKFFQLLKAGQKAPGFEQVLRIFTPQNLVAVQSFQSPDLILRPPGRSFTYLIDAMNAHQTMPKQRGAYVDTMFDRHASLKPETWGIDIAEGADKIYIHDFDDTDPIIRRRIKRFARYKKTNGIKGMDRWKYIALMMKSIKNGKLIDMTSCTILDEDPALSIIGIPFAYSGYDSRDWQICFSDRPPERLHDFSWFRHSVGGKNPLPELFDIFRSARPDSEVEV